MRLTCTTSCQPCCPPCCQRTSQSCPRMESLGPWAWPGWTCSGWSQGSQRTRRSLVSPLRWTQGAWRCCSLAPHSSELSKMINLKIIIINNFYDRTIFQNFGFDTFVKSLSRWCLKTLVFKPLILILMWVKIWIAIWNQAFCITLLSVTDLPMLIGPLGTANGKEITIQFNTRFVILTPTLKT